MTDSPSLTEEEILELVDGAVQLPKTAIWDTIARRLERYEPLAADIETLLSANDFVGCVDKATGQAARRALDRFRDERAKLVKLEEASSGKKETSSGKKYAFFRRSELAEITDNIVLVLQQLKGKVSVEWRSRKSLRTAIDNLSEKLNIPVPDLMAMGESAAKVDQLGDRLEKTYNGLSTQIEFGAWVGRVKDSTGLVRAHVDDKSLPYHSIYLDFGPSPEAKKAEGAFGSIRHAWTSKDRSPGEVFAVKVPCHWRTNQNEIPREGEIWKKLSHPHILKLLGTCSMGGLYKGLITRWIGDSKSWLQSLDDFGEPQHVRFMENIADALQYIHDQGILHADVKLANVIIGRNPVQSLLCDFGFSLERDIHNSRASSKNYGSAAYESPRTLDGDKKCVADDVWSFGIMIAHALTKELPFKDRMVGNDIKGTYKKIYVAENLRPPKPQELTKVGDWAWSIAEACWQERVDDCPPMGEVWKAMIAANQDEGEVVRDWLKRWRERILKTPY